jgi:hypothetical protein
VVVLVEELGDRLGVFCGCSHLDRVGRFCSHSGAPGRSFDVVPSRLWIAARADGDQRHKALPVGSEVQELHVRVGRCKRGELLRQRPEVAPCARQRQAPVVHGDMNEALIRLERYLDLAEVVVQVGVVEREVEEALDDRAQPPRVLCVDSGSGCKRREEGTH